MPLSIITENLSRFGFSQYESKAYVSLVNNNPVTGYEMAKQSGIPPSKIYEVINKLLEKSVISPVQSDPVKYVPLDIDVLLKKFNDETQASLTALKEHLPKSRGISSHYIWDIHAREDLVSKARELITNATDEILLFCWEEELVDLVDVLKKQKQKNIAIVQYGRLPLDFGVVYHHLLEEEKIREKGGREFTLVTDTSFLLQAIIAENRTNLGVLTANASLVGVARDFIHHDIYCWKLIDRMEEQAKSIFGEDFHALRDIHSK